MPEAAVLYVLSALRDLERSKAAVTGITVRLLVSKENVEQWKRSDVQIRSATLLWLCALQERVVGQAIDSTDALVIHTASKLDRLIQQLMTFQLMGTSRPKPTLLFLGLSFPEA